MDSRLVFKNNDIEIYLLDKSDYKIYEDSFIFTMKEEKHFSKYKKNRKYLSKLSIYFIKYLISTKLKIPIKSIEVFYKDDKPFILINNSLSEYYVSVSHDENKLFVSLSKYIHGIDGMSLSEEINSRRYGFFKNKISTKEEFIKLWTRREALIKCEGLSKFTKFDEIDFNKDKLNNTYILNTLTVENFIVSYVFRKDLK